MALKDYQTAYDLLTYVVSRQPDLARARTVMGEWYAAQGDVTRAREEWTTGGQLGRGGVAAPARRDLSSRTGAAEVVNRLSRLAPTVGGERARLPDRWSTSE